MKLRHWIGALLVVGGMASGPALAQSNFSFGLRFGDERSDFVRPPVICLTNYQIRQAIQTRGYTDVALNVPNEQRIQVRARQGGTVYLLDFDFCRDRILGRQRLR